MFKLPYLPSVSSKFKMLGVFWKIQEICSKMGTRILKIALEMTEIIDPKVGNPLEKKAKSAIKWYFQNPVCLTFCAVTWSIFHVGRKVRWVLKSSSSGLLKNGQKFFWMCSVTQENNKIEVQTVLLDTLYIFIQWNWTEYLYYILILRLNWIR